jgi:hypothetical protein
MKKKIKRLRENVHAKDIIKLISRLLDKDESVNQVQGYSYTGWNAT